MDLALDHVIVAVPDLASASAALEHRHGLRATPGGRHPALGTQNAIVPLGGAYLEIIAVADPELAATNEFGRSALSARDSGPRFMGWVLRTDTIEDAAAAWQTEAVPLSRRTPSGSEIRWRMVGLKHAGDLTRPMIIEWEDLVAAPPSVPPVHPAGTVMLDHAEIGDPGRLLGTWLPHVDHVRLTASGPPGVHAVRLTVGGSTLAVTEAAFAR